MTRIGCFASSLFLLLLAGQQAAAFYLPGVAPKDYKSGEVVPLFVNAVSSSKTVRMSKVSVGAGP